MWRLVRALLSAALSQTQQKKQSATNTSNRPAPSGKQSSDSGSIFLRPASFAELAEDDDDDSELTPDELWQLIVDLELRITQLELQNDELRVALAHQMADHIELVQWQKQHDHADRCRCGNETDN
jgi:hypothetical protein